MRQQLFFEDLLKDFANDRREADGSVVRGVCDWGYYCAMAILGDLAA